MPDAQPTAQTSIERAQFTAVWRPDVDSFSLVVVRDLLSPHVVPKSEFYTSSTTVPTWHSFGEREERGGIRFVFAPKSMPMALP